MDVTNVKYAIVEVFNDEIEDVKFASSKEEAQLKANLMLLDILLFEDCLTREEFHDWVKKAKLGDLPRDTCEIDDCETMFTSIDDEGTFIGGWVDMNKFYYTGIINVENQNRRWCDEPLEDNESKEENKDE